MTTERIWEERRLREAILAGDEDAWRLLYDRWFASLYAHVRFRCSGDGHRAEEVVQETWMVAVRGIERFDPERASFGTWLFGISHKVLNNTRRRWWRRSGVELPREDAGEMPGPAPSPGERLAVAEHIHVTLAGLPEAYRDVLRAKYERGDTVAEIAEARNQSPKAAESLLTRARVAFRRRFAELEQEHD